MYQRFEKQAQKFIKLERTIQKLCGLHLGSNQRLGMIYIPICFIVIFMRGALGRGKEILLRRQHQRNLEKHLDRIRQIKTNSAGWEWTSGQPTLNQQKKHRMLEDKITQIQRENRHLLQRITHTINKTSPKDSDIDKMNRSLNYSFRKKQTQSIDMENSKLLKRLQEKKSKYEAEKMKQEWKKQKEVIKNIANFPFILRDGSKRPRRRTISKQMQTSLATQRRKLKSAFQLVRIRKIDGVDLIITIKLNEVKLTIIGEDKKKNNLKIIQIPHDEAIQFLDKQCNGRIDHFLDKLRYDAQRQVLQLRSRESYNNAKTEDELLPKQNKFLIADMQSI